MKITLIVSGYDAGQYGIGWGKGAQAIAEASVASVLADAGHDVELQQIGQIDGVQDREISTGFAVCAAIAKEVRSARENGRLPVVIAGNCMTAVGAVAGENADGIVWVDQHGDLHTPDTSASGLLDGMALATVLGLCWKPITRELVGLRPIDPANCLLLDARDLDAAEAQLVRDLRVRHVPWQNPMDDLSGIDQLARVHLHLDLDVHNPDSLRANVYDAPGGPSPQQLRGAAAALARSLPLCGLTITAYDPTFDPDNRVPQLVAQLLTDILDQLSPAEASKAV